MATDVKLLWGPASLCAWSSLNYTDWDLDDANDSIAIVFCAPKDGDIDRVGFFSTVENGSPPDYKVSIETLTLVGHPSGTDAGGSTPGTYSPSGAGWHWVSLATPATISAGDLLAAVIRPGATPPDAANSIDIGNTVVRDMGTPRLEYFSTSWLSNRARPLHISVQYDDGEVYSVGCIGVQGDQFDTADSPDEQGCKFTVPMDMTCFGARIGMCYCGSSASFDICLYDSGDVLIASMSIADEDYIAAGGVATIFDVHWDEVALVADAVYRITVKATHATLSVRPAMLTFADTDLKAFLPEGARWQTTERTDAGAWTDEALECCFMAVWINDMIIGNGNGGGGAWAGGVIIG